MGKIAKPLVSVIIPTYKNRGLLIQSIDSALLQDYPNIEIIVIDDNNPETNERYETEKLMDKYSSNPSVIYLKHERNKNGAAARNTGIYYANGDYIAFLDDDDCFLPGKIKKQIQFLDNHKEFAAVYCLAFVGDNEEPTIPYEGNAIIPLLMNKTKMFTPTLLFKKEAILDIGCFDESFRRHQDYELLVKFFEKGYQIGCLQERLVVIHPIGDNRLTPVQHEEMKGKYLRTFEKSIDRIDNENPGIKKRIIANNYASVFVSDIACRDIKSAMKVFHKYFWVSPLGFFDYLWYFLKRSINKRAHRN